MVLGSMWKGLKFIASISSKECYFVVLSACKTDVGDPGVELLLEC